MTKPSDFGKELSKVAIQNTGDQAAKKDKKDKKPQKKKFRPTMGRGGGLSMKAQLEGNLPGRKKYKSGGIVKKKLDGIAKRGKTKGRMI
jgi:hypothetical protein